MYTGSFEVGEDTVFSLLEAANYLQIKELSTRWGEGEPGVRCQVSGARCQVSPLHDT